jgi:predicted nucleotidyltransferase component of viral defense system
MSDTTETPPYHENAERFVDALRLAESTTGFRAALIEKDYYCTILLQDFVALFGRGLVFKGGTCLSKVHTDFLRLSEDLDFGVSISPDARQSARRKAVEPFKPHFVDIPPRLGCFRVAEPLTGHDASRQYNGRLAYRSVMTGEDEFLKVEIGLREDVLLPTPDLPARTLLMDPNTNAPAIPPVNVRALSLQEAYSEKVRAALTRRDPAIRDFFDIDSAVQKALLNHLAPDFLQLVAQKLAVTDDPVDTSPTKVNSLKAQLEAQLKPFLRTTDYEAFLLERAISMLQEVAARCRFDWAGKGDILH